MILESMILTSISVPFFNFLNYIYNTKTEITRAWLRLGLELSNRYDFSSNQTVIKANHMYRDIFLSFDMYILDLRHCTCEMLCAIIPSCFLMLMS